MPQYARWSGLVKAEALYKGVVEEEELELEEEEEVKEEMEVEEEAK